VRLSLFFLKSRSTEKNLVSLSFDPSTSARVFTQKKTRKVLRVFLLLQTKSDAEKSSSSSLFLSFADKSALFSRAFDSRKEVRLPERKRRGKSEKFF